MDEVVNIYTSLVEDGRIDEGNLFLVLLAGYAAFLWEGGLISSEELGKYFESLRSELLEGPNLLNPYVMELLSILAEGLNELLFTELIEKLRITLREERLDRLEI